MRVIVAMSPASTGGQLQRQIQLVRLIQRKLFVDIQSLAFLEHHKPAVAVQYFDRDLLELVILCAVLACMRVADFHEHKCSGPSRTTASKGATTCDSHISTGTSKCARWPGLKRQLIKVRFSESDV